MNYSTFSTRSIEKMLNGAAAGSAEHQALQAELQKRAAEKPKPKDDRTLLLFDSSVWEGIR